MLSDAICQHLTATCEMIAFVHVVARNNFVFVVAMIDIFYLNRRPQKMIDVNATECYAACIWWPLKFLFLYSLDHRMEYRMFI